MEYNSVFDRTSDQQNCTTARSESDLLIKSMIADRIGQHKVLMSINHINITVSKGLRKDKKPVKISKNSPIYDFV